MDDHPIKHPAPFHQKITRSGKTLDFYLKLLLLLLENVKHNQSLMQHCPVRTEDGRFSNFTSEAGAPFFLELPIPPAQGHTQYHQLSLADGDGTLPHWMKFRRQTGSLTGLALTEDCGIYHLKVSVFAVQCAAYFYLHILNTTVTSKDPARDILACSEEETTIWANLLVHLKPVTLDASQRIRLVSTMAEYLHLPLGFVYLFSRRKSFMQQEEKLRVCMQGGLADTPGNEKQDSSGDVAELLWAASCQTEERQSDLAKVLQNSVQSGALARVLDAPVLGWRVLCAPGKVRHKVKRDLQRLKFTPTPNMVVPPPTQVHQTVKLKYINSLPLNKPEPSLFSVLLDIDHMGTKLEPTHKTDSVGNAVSEDVIIQPFDTQPYSPENAFKFTSKGCPLMPEMQLPTLYPFSKDVNHPHQLSVHNPHKDINQAWLSASTTKPLIEAAVCSEQITSQSISEYHPTTALCLLSDTPLSTLLPSSTLHSIYPSLPLTPASYSVTSTLTHEAVDRKSPTTRLTLRPDQEETPLWTGSYRASRTDSESQPTVSSLGHIISNQGPARDRHTAKPTLYNLPSVPHLPPTEHYNDVPLLNSTLKTKQSLPPSNKIPSTQLFPDVSPTSHLMTDRLSTTQHSDTIQHLSSALNQDVMSQLNVTTQDASSTSWSTGETELESSLSASLFEPSVAMFTPALPSEQLGTPSIVTSVFIVESPKASLSTTQLLQTFSKSLLPYIGVSSLQNNVESTDLQPITGTELCFQNTPMQTLSLDILSMSLQPTQALQTSLSVTLSHSVPKDKPSKQQPCVKSGPESEQSRPSVQQTLHTLLFEESPQISTFSNTFLVTVMTTSMYLKTSAGPHVTSLSIFASSALLVSEHYFDPTAPSTVEEPYTTSFIHQVQNLDPSLCGRSVSWSHMYGNGCTLQIRSTSIEKTVEHVLDSFSQDENHLNTFPSQFDSSGRFFLTQTFKKDFSMHPLSSNEFMSLLLVSTMHLCATAAINYATATPQMDVSGTLPALEGTGFSVITSVALTPSAFSGSCVSLENSLLICQSSATGSITKGRPAQQILSTTLSRFYGTSAALLTSLLAVGLSSYRRESLVRPTLSSAFISSSMNLPPKVLQSIPVLTATVGFPFSYSVPPQTFLDPEDGDADALSMEIRLIDGPPVSAGTWLALDGLELHGVPLEVDLQFAPQHLLLAARDRQGLSTWLPLTLDLRRSRVDPCHVFTLTAQRSLHSVLRQRRRVELLLRKLSRFFNSSSSHHLSVVSIRPGSTVVSWYNYSLCALGHSRNTRCHVDQIRSMWLAMRSAGGSVKAAFREAMLPEFPVTKVGPVSYRRDCFSTSSTPIFDRSTPAVHTTPTPAVASNTSFHPTLNTCISTFPAINTSSQQVTNFQWMAGMFTALLVICLLILIVLLIAAVLYFCRGHRRSRPVAIWPADRVLSVQSRDLRAIRPRRPPLLQPEVPPPPLKLWIHFSQGDDGRLPSTREQRKKTVDKALRPRPPQYDFSTI